MLSNGPLRRKRRKRYEIPGQARYLTFSCFQRLPLFNNSKIRDRFVVDLARCRDEQKFLLLAWVIMLDHAHLLIVPNLPDVEISKVLQQLKGGFANHVLSRWRQLQAPILGCLVDARGKEHFWQIGGGYDRNLYTPAEVQEKVNYIHNNPVRRGLVSTPVEWLWSSARWYAGIRESKYPEIDPFEL